MKNSKQLHKFVTNIRIKPILFAFFAFFALKLKAIFHSFILKRKKKRFVFRPDRHMNNSSHHKKPVCDNTKKTPRVPSELTLKIIAQFSRTYCVDPELQHTKQDFMLN